MKAPARCAAACAARSKASKPLLCHAARAPATWRFVSSIRLTSGMAKTSMPDSRGSGRLSGSCILGGRQAGKAPDFGSGSEGSSPSRPARRESVFRSVKDEVKIFAGNSNRALANALSAHLGVPLAGVEIGRFSDGEVQGDMVDNVYATPIILGHLRERLGRHDVTVIAPDAGGVERARAFAKRLDANLAIIDKRRVRPNEVAEVQIVGEVEARHAVIIDDIVDTAGTLCAAGEAVRAAGAPVVIACDTHPVLSGPAVDRLARSALDELIVTDTIPLNGDAARLPNLRVLSVAPLLGEAIRRTHEEESISSLFI